MLADLRHNKRMRPYGTSTKLQKRRQQAEELFEEGRTVEQAAKQVGVTARSIYRWQREKKHPKKNFCEAHTLTDMLKTIGHWIASGMSSGNCLRYGIPRVVFGV